MRPLQSSDLSFVNGGVIREQLGASSDVDEKVNKGGARLGEKISAFDTKAYVELLKKEISSPPPDGDLTHNSTKIREELGRNALFGQRNDMLATVLDQAISQRKLAFLQRYKHKAELADLLEKVYKSGVTNKFARIEQLQALSTARTNLLRTSYNAMAGKDEEYGVDGVLTKSVVTNESAKSASSVTTQLAAVAMRTGTQTIHVDGDGGKSTHTVDPTDTLPGTVDTGGAFQPMKGNPNLVTQQTETDGGTQTSTTINAEFRAPQKENEMKEHRMQVDLWDEYLANRVAQLQAEDAAAMLDEELKSLDHEVLKAQILYLESFITSPVAGLITAIYKDAGECVKSGDPVMRVESEGELLLTGIVLFRAALRPRESKVKITVKEPFERGAVNPIILDGTVVSVRGHDVDDDEWDIVIYCQDNQHQLPINYQFDRNTTDIELL